MPWWGYRLTRTVMSYPRMLVCSASNGRRHAPWIQNWAFQLHWAPRSSGTAKAPNCGAPGCDEECVWSIEFGLRMFAAFSTFCTVGLLGGGFACHAWRVVCKGVFWRSLAELSVRAFSFLKIVCESRHCRILHKCLNCCLRCWCFVFESAGCLFEPLRAHSMWKLKTLIFTSKKKNISKSGMWTRRLIMATIVIIMSSRLKDKHNATWIMSHSMSTRKPKWAWWLKSLCCHTNPVFADKNMVNHNKAEALQFFVRPQRWIRNVCLRSVLTEIQQNNIQQTNVQTRKRIAYPIKSIAISYSTTIALETALLHPYP